MSKLRISLSVIFLLSLMISSACDQTNPSTQAQGQLAAQQTNTPKLITPSLTSTFTELPTLTSTATIPPPTNTTIPTNTASPTPSCTNQAEFVKHLTIGDNTALKSGEYFAKLWRIRNIGTCIWDGNYSLVFVSGDGMDGPASIPFPSMVKPGETIDLRVDLRAPMEKNTYTSNYLLSDANGNIFGLGSTGDQEIAVTIVIKATPWPASGCNEYEWS
jgi:hypothetical protein